jgi:hypothetical protein
MLPSRLATAGTVDRADVDCRSDEWQQAHSAKRRSAQAPRSRRHQADIVDQAKAAHLSFDGTHEATPLAFLVAGVCESERQSRVRELRVLSLVLFGARHEITVALSEAVAVLSTAPSSCSMLPRRYASTICSQRSGA